jgi:hypothetical protein
LFDESRREAIVFVDFGKTETGSIAPAVFFMGRIFLPFA